MIKNDKDINYAIDIWNKRIVDKLNIEKDSSDDEKLRLIELFINIFGIKKIKIM